MRLIFDAETDGLLQEVTKIHCISAIDVDSSWSRFYIGAQIKEFIDKISDPSVELIGHNIQFFDLLVLKKLYGWVPYKEQKITDTMLLAELLFSDLKNDDESSKDIFPGRVFSKKDKGRHSLKAWGQRVKCFKGEYTGTWEKYNDDMGRYCIQDTNTTKVLLKFLESKIPEKLIGTETIELENSIAPILGRQQNYGVLYDKEKSDNLILTLTGHLVELKWQLQEIFKPRYINKGEFTPKRNDRIKGYVAGAVFTKIEMQEFNPGSRPQIVSRLITEYDWNPEEFTDAGNAKMDEAIIDNLPFKQLEPLKQYLTVKKRLSQIDGGKQAWTKKIDKDGRIRGSVVQNGTITGRMAHFGPNLAQVVADGKLYGKECRELFTVPKGKVMIGCDADSLEMRNLAGYINSIDGGRFQSSVLKGKKEEGTDPHTINMYAYGISDRDCSKSLFYSGIYGAKNAKFGAILKDYGINFDEYVPDFEKNVKGMMQWVKEKNEELRAKGQEPIERTKTYWECWVAGKHCMVLFGDQIPEMKQLKDKIHERVKEVGYIKGLDGRKLFMRSQHAELNTVLQSAGAIIMKKALYIADTDLQESGLTPGKDYEFILNIHDEFQLEVTDDKKIIDTVSYILENSIKKAGEYFKFPCPHKGTVKVGRDWSQCH